MKQLYQLISIILLSSCLSEDPLNNPFTSIEPMDIGDGHVLSYPSAEAMDSSGLIEIYKQVYNDENLWSLRSMLVFRNGRLVSESYLKNNEDIMIKHLIWSCTKQVMSVLTGIAIEKGLISSLDDPISKYLEKEMINHPDKANITIRDLLNMQSGIAFSNDGVNGQTDKILRQLPDNILEFILDLPMKELPGTMFNYKDGDPQLMASIIQKVTGKPTDSWADEVLFSKIGMKNYDWDRYRDGQTFGGFGLITTPRELAKIALCVSNGGLWEDRQIVNQEWIDTMTSSQVKTEGEYEFGHYWWIDPSRNIHFMWGHGGQFAFIVPEKDLVVVMTSIPNTQGDYEIQADEALPVVDMIIDICD
ncbi:serine hydrolase domain-containing protein [Bacteroidota bacterium]